MTLESQVIEGVKAVFAANRNRRQPQTNVRLVPDERINLMVAQLEGLRPRGLTFERHTRAA